MENGQNCQKFKNVKKYDNTPFSLTPFWQFFNSSKFRPFDVVFADCEVLALMEGLVAESVTYAYPDGTQALREVSVQVSYGQLLGIVGPNGSGKSTLLRVLAGFFRPEQGRVSLDGKALHTYGRYERARQIGFLPQSVLPAFSFSVREVVAMGRYPHLGAFGFLSRGDVEVVERCLDAVECTDLADRPFSALSGGERQRVLLASVLAQEPKLMLFDEPTAALDIHHQVAIFDLLHAFSREGLGIGVVTHDLNLAGQFCDRLLLLQRGRTIKEGTPEEVIVGDLLSEVYDADLIVDDNPVTGTPMVMLLGQHHHGREDHAPAHA